MNYLENFIDILCGTFDNSEQYNKLLKDGINNFPFAKHVNTVCNDKITNLPIDFNGYFVIEESYYTLNGKTNSSPHLFLFTEEDSKIKLTSYEIPEKYDKTTFSYSNIDDFSFLDLKISEKFNPAIYELKDGVWEGGSISMFSPILKFTLFERFSKDVLEVSESMEVNGKRTFGFDQPILYKRTF